MMSYSESVHMSQTDHPNSQPSFDIPPTWTPLSQQKSINYNSIQCRLSGKFVFLALVSHGEFRLFSDDLYLDSSLVHGLIHVEFLIF
jgi:hypothetical protein